MASNITELVLDGFPLRSDAATSNGSVQEALALFSTAASDLPALIGGLTEAVGELTNSSRTQSSVVSAASRAVVPTAAVEKDSAGSTAIGVVSGFFKGGAGAVPLVQGLIRLFGGESEAEAPAPLVKYSRPEPVYLEAALWDGVVEQSDRDQSGAVRRYVHSVEQDSYKAAARESRDVGVEQKRESIPRASTATQQVVNVTVHAMDSRSFLDHSQDIARAVKEAMLHSNSINDVVSEL